MSNNNDTPEHRKNFPYDIPTEGNVFYKYQSPNANSFASLETQYFWFSKREELNDPHESRCIPQESISDEEVVKYAKIAADLGEFQAIGKPDNLDKFINNANNEIALIRDYWLGSIKDNCEIAEQSKSKIFCVSDNLYSPTMWTHYTNNHEGWVIGFDPLKIFKDMPALAWVRVQYQEEFPLFTVDDLIRNPEFMRKLYATKSDEWAYEKEWRCRSDIKYDAMYFEQDAVKLIAFGMNCSDDTISKVKSLTEEWGIEYLTMVPSKTKYRMEVKE